MSCSLKSRMCAALNDVRRWLICCFACAILQFVLSRGGNECALDMLARVFLPYGGSQCQVRMRFAFSVLSSFMSFLSSPTAISMHTYLSLSLSLSVCLSLCLFLSLSVSLSVSLCLSLSLSLSLAASRAHLGRSAIPPGCWRVLHAHWELTALSQV
jgi:hypothetical protein